jgi:hypothetical protein
VPREPQAFAHPEPLEERRPAPIERRDGGIDRGNQAILASGPQGGLAQCEPIIADARVRHVQCLAVERGWWPGERGDRSHPIKHVETDAGHRTLLARAAIGTAVEADPQVLEKHGLPEQAGDLLRAGDKAVKKNRRPRRAELWIDPRMRTPGDRPHGGGIDGCGHPHRGETVGEEVPEAGEHRAVVFDPAEIRMHAHGQIGLDDDRIDAVGGGDASRGVRKPCDPLLVGERDIAADHRHDAVELASMGGERVGGINAAGVEGPVSPLRRVRRIDR